MEAKTQREYTIHFSINLTKAGSLYRLAERKGISVGAAHVSNSVTRGIEEYVGGQPHLEKTRSRNYGNKAFIRVKDSSGRKGTIRELEKVLEEYLSDKYVMFCVEES